MTEYWRVFVIQPCIHKDQIKVKDDIDSFHMDVCPYDGETICTDWKPDIINKLTEYIKKMGVKSVDWYKICLCNYKAVIRNLPNTPETIVFNLCDGNEDEGWPGTKVIEELEKHKLTFTGSSAAVYALDASKIKMKQHLTLKNVSTPKFLICNDMTNLNINHLKMPVIVKPSNSSSSVGLFEDSVCSNEDQITIKVREIINKYGPVYIEEYITGREFTIFCCRSINDVFALMPLERVFNKNLPENEQFLSYDTKWNQWLNKWWYQPVTNDIADDLKLFATESFKQAELDGYCRYDIRQDKETNIFYIVDVNLNCSMDVEEETALQIMLKATGMKMNELLANIFKLNFARKIENDNIKQLQ